MLKTIIAVVLLAAMVIPVNNYAAPMPNAPAPSHKHVSSSIRDAEVGHADIRRDKPKEGEGKREEYEPLPRLEPPRNEPLSFRTVNGVGVDWSKEELLAGKGMPEDMRRDELLNTIELDYGDVIVGWYGEGIDYLIVPASAGSILISGTRLPLNYTALRLALGKPDYTAEDGIVYERDGLCLKLFLTPGTGAPDVESVQIYWSAAI